jgi:hypothetical protein
MLLCCGKFAFMEWGILPVLKVRECRGIFVRAKEDSEGNLLVRGNFSEKTGSRLRTWPSAVRNRNCVRGSHDLTYVESFADIWSGKSALGMKQKRAMTQGVLYNY